MKNFFRKGMLTLTMLLLTLFMSFMVLAEDGSITIPTGKKGIVLKIMQGEWEEEGETVTADPVTMSMYLLADLQTIDGVPTYVLNPALKGLEESANLEFLNKEYGDDLAAYNKAVQEAMPAIEAFCQENVGAALMNAIPDKNGNYVYTGLGRGWYVMVQTSGEEIAEFESMLAPLPYKDKSGEMVSALILKAKGELKKGALILNKVCSTEGKEPIYLEGAKFLLESQNDDGEWRQIGFLPITNENGQTPLKSLPLGRYRIKEVTAPKGYVWRDDEEEFIISCAGDIESVKGKFVPIDGAVECEFENEKAKDNTLEVTKKMQYLSIDPQTGAMLGIPIEVKEADIYVALFEDEACTNRISDVKTIHIEGSDSGKVIFDAIKTGETYYLAETDEYGIRKDGGYLEFVDEKIEYKPSYLWEGKMPSVIGEDGEAVLEFANNFLKWPDHYSVDGKLWITKQVLNPQKQTVFAKDLPAGEDGIFYAGIFEKDASGKLILVTDLDQTQPNPVPLDLHDADPATGIVTSDVIVLHLADSIKEGEIVTKEYTVMETDKEGNPIAGKPNFIYNVDIDGGELVEIEYSTDPNSPALEYQVDIKNQMKPTVTPTGGPQITPTKPASPGSGGGSYGGKSAVQTGDTTPWLAYVLTLVAAAAVVIVAVIFIKKRK